MDKVNELFIRGFQCKARPEDQKPGAENSINPLKPAKYVNQHTQRLRKRSRLSRSSNYSSTMEIDCRRAKREFLMVH